MGALESSVFQTGFLGDLRVPQGCNRGQVQEAILGKKRNVCRDTYTYFPRWVTQLPAPSPTTALLISVKQGELPGKMTILKTLSHVFILFSYYCGLAILLPLPRPHTLLRE